MNAEISRDGDWLAHLHCVVSRGVWLAGGEWIPVPYIDTHAAEILFREKVFRLLQQHDLLSDERIKILRSWRHSGFNIHNDVYLYPSDTQAIETLSRYIVRCPVSIQRLHYEAELLDPLTLRNFSPGCSFTFPSPTSIPSCTTATTPDEHENIPEKIDPQLTTTSSTPPSAKILDDDGPT